MARGLKKDPSAAGEGRGSDWLFGVVGKTTHGGKTLARQRGIW